MSAPEVREFTEGRAFVAWLEAERICGPMTGWKIVELLRFASIRELVIEEHRNRRRDPVRRVISAVVFDTPSHRGRIGWRVSTEPVPPDPERFPPRGQEAGA